MISKLREDDLVDLAREVKEKYRFDLLLKSHVNGIGLGTWKRKGTDTSVPCIVVYVYPKVPQETLHPADRIPPAIDGILTDVVETAATEAPIRKSGTVADPETIKRHRPAPCGVSVGHYQLQGAGTLSSWVEYKGELLLMSSWHILTNFGKAKRGDPILQPALVDGGCVKRDTIAYLQEWTDVKMLGPTLGEAKSNLKALIDQGKTLPLNYIDVALAKPISEDVVSHEILHAGRQEVFESRIGIGDGIIQVGRTSGLVQGRISAIDVDMFIKYRTEVALFLDVVTTSPGIKPGDSGSPVLMQARPYFIKKR